LFLYCFKAVCVFWTNLLPFWIKDKMFMIAGKMGMRPGYLEKGKVPKDPWGREYLYLSPGVHGDYDIISYGADGAPGGQGDDQDINSWEIY
jgi:type II secretory pathway pseudopilin PulG